MKPFSLIVFAIAGLLGAARGENLLQNGSFELPTVNGRTDVSNGGNPANAGDQTGWAEFLDKRNNEGGQLIVGLTTEIAHSGKQAIFVDFSHLTAPSQRAELTTKLLPIKPSHSYRISIWGRMDRKRPLALDERRPHMWVDMEFLQADQTTAAGEGEHAIVLIPGSIVPGGTNELLFVARRWTQAVAVVETPKTAAFLQVTWSWATPKDEGETDGVIYWDDAAIEEEPPAPSPAEESKASPPSGAAEPSPTPAAKGDPVSRP
jgi:hypothetical protein